MSRRGENIYKRKDNRWEGRYIKGYDPKGKARLGYVYAKTYREAKEKLAEAKNAVTQNIPASRKTFDYYCDQWLMLSRNRIKESSYVKYHNMVTKHIKPYLGSYRPLLINTVIIEGFSNGLLVSGLSPKTVRDVLVVLKSILQHCRNQLGAGLPNLEIIYPKERKQEIRILSMEEQKVLVQQLCLEMNEVKFGILLSLLTGMRIGEICAMRWENISMEKRMIRIESTMQRLQNITTRTGSRTSVVVGEAKSCASIRVIPLTDMAFSLCETMRPEHGTGYVLTGKDDKFMEPRVLQYHFSRIIQECKLEGVHFHTLRHTFATRCVEVGFEIKSLSEILGHSSTKVTLDRYVHSSLELKRTNMEKLAGIF